MEQELLLEEIDPFVRSALIVPLPPGIGESLHMSYDHRLFYVLSGSAEVELAGKRTQLKPGSVVYWTAGTEYTFYYEESTQPELIAVNFDFTHGHSALVQYLPAVVPEDYEPDKCLEKICIKNAPLLNGWFVLEDGSDVFSWLQAMVREADAAIRFSDFLLTNLMRMVLTVLCRNAELQFNPRIDDSFHKILEYIHAHYREALSNQTVAAAFGYHPNYISKLFKDHTEAPLHQYLLKLRIRQALILLQGTGLTVGEIARQVGFESTGYFCRYFKKCTGYSPASFRR